MQIIAVHVTIARRNCRLAFTLIELLVTITIIALLAAALLASLSRAHSAAKATACESNLRQMGLAFALYLPEYNDCFPTAALKSSLGPQPEDWVWWQVQKTASGSVTMRDPARGSVIRELGAYNSQYLRCPADHDALNRQVLWEQNPGHEQYFYSYSLNGYDEHGMASFISLDRSIIFLNRGSAIVHPANKIMLAEEKGGPKDGPGLATIDDGRWQPPGYPLTSRHSGGANVTFADGHAARVQHDFADSNHPGRYAPGL
jgi:prepilin-type processing-associated H-X9-DG protein/prepilin-type N-terminal cleavage/methylation domain-containing protein